MTLGGIWFPGVMNTGKQEVPGLLTTVEGTEGWSLAINAPTKDFTQSTVNSIIITIILMVVFLAISSYMAYRLARQIGEPVKDCAQQLEGCWRRGIWIHLFMRYIPGDETQILADSARTLVRVSATDSGYGWKCWQRCQGNLTAQF